MLPFIIIQSKFFPTFFFTSKIIFAQIISPDELDFGKFKNSNFLFFLSKICNYDNYKMQYIFLPIKMGQIPTYFTSEKLFEAKNIVSKYNV